MLRQQKKERKKETHHSLSADAVQPQYCKRSCIIKCNFVRLLALDLCAEPCKPIIYIYTVNIVKNGIVFQVLFFLYIYIDDLLITLRLAGVGGYIASNQYYTVKKSSIVGAMRRLEATWYKLTASAIEPHVKMNK